jgi:hypothetical protein
LDNQREAEIEAASSLAAIARELDPFASSEDLTIEAIDHRSTWPSKFGTVTARSSAPRLFRKKRA